MEQFQTEVPIPNWDLGDEGAEYVDENQVGFEPLVDENGNPLPNQPTDTMPAPGTQLPPQGGQVDQQWLDQVLPPGSQQRPGVLVPRRQLAAGGQRDPWHPPGRARLPPEPRHAQCTRASTATPTNRIAR